MHTRVDLLLKGNAESHDALIAAADEVHTLINAIAKEGNCFDPGSILSRFNTLAPGESIDGGRYLYGMLSQCKRYHALTEGLFDVSVESQGHSPGMIESIHILDGNAIRKNDRSLRVNLSGFIKGYALDRIRESLLKRGVDNALVNMGNSSVMALGNVAVQMPKACLTTSGNTAGRPCQIIDPHTGTAVTRAGTVQIATNSGAEGEVLATAFFIAGTETERGKALSLRFPNAIVTKNA